MTRGAAWQIYATLDRTFVYFRFGPANSHASARSSLLLAINRGLGVCLTGSECLRSGERSFPPYVQDQERTGTPICPSFLQDVKNIHLAPSQLRTNRGRTKMLLRGGRSSMSISPILSTRNIRTFESITLSYINCRDMVMHGM